MREEGRRLNACKLVKAAILFTLAPCLKTPLRHCERNAVERSNDEVGFRENEGMKDYLLVLVPTLISLHPVFWYAILIETTNGTRLFFA